MRSTLLVDALAPQPGGIGRYTRELCKGLQGRDDVDVRFVAHGRLIEDPTALLRSTRLPRLSRLRRWIDRRAVRGLLGSTLVHGPNYFLPDGVDGGVITVHDLSVFRFPETHPAERVRQFEKLFRSSLDRSSQIITDTETVRAEVIAAFGVPDDRVTAIPLGVDARFRPHSAEESRETLASLGLEPGGYGLCVSTLEPRKKIAELLHAWEHLSAGLRDRFPLVLAGGSGWRNEGLRELVDRGTGQGWLKHLGFVDEAEIPALYAGARLFIYPSVYEGFGLPPLEAMASGVPVIVSNLSCLPEVCGPAATYIDPFDLEGFSNAIEEALGDEARREKQVETGLERAASFTWARCVEGTVGVYRAALAEGAGQG